MLTKLPRLDIWIKAVVTILFPPIGNWKLSGHYYIAVLKFAISCGRVYNVADYCGTSNGSHCLLAGEPTQQNTDAVKVLKQ